MNALDQIDREKPASIDDLLLKMLQENPSLIAELEKKAPKTPQQPKQARQFKAPSEDYLLVIYSGCETCHTIVENVFEMKWDSERNCFRQRNYKGSLEVDKKVQKQIITIRICLNCSSTLSALEVSELITIILNQTDPEKELKRLLELKKKLRSLL